MADGCCRCQAHKMFPIKWAPLGLVVKPSRERACSAQPGLGLSGDGVGSSASCPKRCLSARREFPNLPSPVPRGAGQGQRCLRCAERGSCSAPSSPAGTARPGAETQPGTGQRQPGVGQRAWHGAETALHGAESLARGRETAWCGAERAWHGAESRMRGRDSPARGKESTVMGRDSLV